MNPEMTELVFIPYPAMGHLVSMVETAKQLIGRDHRLSITVLIMKTPFDESKVISTTQSLILAVAEHRLKFFYLPHQDEPALAELQSKNPIKFMSEFVDLNKKHVGDHVKNMVSTESSRLAGFVVDMLCTPMMDLAAEFGLPTYVFYASSCAFLGLIFHLEAMSRDEDVTELKDSDAELDVPVFVNPVPVNVLPAVVLDKKGGSAFVLGFTKRLRETKGIMVNTFEELESYAVKHLADDDTIPPIYPVGPALHLVKEEEEEEEEEVEVIHIMRWLDNQPQSSVLFLCFGGMGSFDGDQLREIAQALEQSGHRFLWSVRQPPLKGKLEMLSDYQDLNQALPEGFLKRTAKIGKVIGWAPQVAVLSHIAVGGFVSHCGWNSTLESLWCGVPIATWPIYAEQQMNAFELVRELGLAIEIKLDYERDYMCDGIKAKLVTADEIEKGIRKLMENGDKCRTEGIRHKMKEMSEKSKVAIKKGGSSYNSIGRFVNDVIINLHSP